MSDLLTLYRRKMRNGPLLYNVPYQKWIVNLWIIWQVFYASNGNRVWDTIYFHHLFLYHSWHVPCTYSTIHSLFPISICTPCDLHAVACTDSFCGQVLEGGGRRPCGTAALLRYRGYCTVLLHIGASWYAFHHQAFVLRWLWQHGPQLIAMKK